MTSATKSRLQYLGVMLLFAAIIVTLLSLLGYVGRAFAQVTVTPTVYDDPVSMIIQAYDFMRTGKGTAAVGIVSMIVVWGLRSDYLLGRVAFFKTKLGGYLLGFAVPTIQYVAGALIAMEDASAITFSLFVNAVGAGFLASGGWVALKDILTSKSAVARTATTALLIAAVAGLATPGCGPNSPIPGVAHAVIDCAQEDGAALDDMRNKYLTQVLTGQANWPLIKQDAKHLGMNFTACLVGELVNSYLGSRKGAFDDQAQRLEARQVFDDLKVELGGAEIKSRSGKSW